MEEEHNPFQSPELAPAYSAANSLRGGPAAPFASGHVRAMFTMSILAIIALCDVLGCLVYVSQDEMLDAAAHGRRPTYAQAQANDQRVRGIGIGQRVAYIVCGIAFLMWVHRTYRNLPALGATRLETTPGWAVGWWFVPIANLVKPYNSMAETWRYSDPNQQGRIRRTTSSLVGFWWGAYLISRASNVVIAMIAQSQTTRPTIDSLKDATNMAIGILAFEFVAAIVAIVLVFRIDQNQQAMHDLIATAEQAAPAVMPYGY